MILPPKWLSTTVTKSLEAKGVEDLTSSSSFEAAKTSSFVGVLSVFASSTFEPFEVEVWPTSFPPRISLDPLIDCEADSPPTL